MSPAPVSASARRSVSPIGALHDDAAGKGVLHDREADEEHDEHEAAGERRLDHVVDEMPGDGQPGGERPDEEQHPGRDQHDGAVEAVRGEIDDQREAERRR